MAEYFEIPLFTLEDKLANNYNNPIAYLPVFSIHEDIIKDNENTQDGWTGYANKDDLIPYLWQTNGEAYNIFRQITETSPVPYSIKNKLYSDLIAKIKQYRAYDHGFYTNSFYTRGSMVLYYVNANRYNKSNNEVYVFKEEILYLADSTFSSTKPNNLPPYDIPNYNPYYQTIVDAGYTSAAQYLLNAPDSDDKQTIAEQVLTLGSIGEANGRPTSAKVVLYGYIPDISVLKKYQSGKVGSQVQFVLFLALSESKEKYLYGESIPSNICFNYFASTCNLLNDRSGVVGFNYRQYQYMLTAGLGSSFYRLPLRYILGSNVINEIKKGKYWEGYPNQGNTEPQQQKDSSSGQGDYDNTNDPIEFPTVPLKTASLSGMVSLWNPEIQEISQLNSYLWSPEVVDILKKFWNDPMDGIISLSLVPVDVGATEYREVRIGGNYTGIQMKRIFNQIQKVNMGKLKFAEYFGSFADYSPYTTVYIYLPYIGMTQLNVDDIMDCDLELEYMIDLFDGTTVANLRSIRVWDGLAGIVGSWAGNCQTQIPVSSVSYREMLAGAARAGIGMLTGSMVAGAALGAQPQPQWKNNPFYVPETGEFMSYRTFEGDNTNVLNERAMGGSLQMQGVQGMNMGLNAKGQVSRGGNANCTAGALSVQTPYLIINRPVSAMPDGINDFIGYPSYSRGRLGDQQGFTQVLYVKLENLTATQKERAELDQILKGGVIF